jgi:hypothetical protein
MQDPWSLGELRAAAARWGVDPTDDDLERVRAFLDALWPAFEELERLVPAEIVPAGLFLPAGPT